MRERKIIKPKKVKGKRNHKNYGKREGERERETDRDRESQNERETRERERGGEKIKR